MGQGMGGQPGMPGMGPNMGMPAGMGATQPMGGQPGMQGMQQGGPPKTMMLQNTEGIVSVAAAQRGAQLPAGPVPASGPVPVASTGASGAFWAVSLFIGAAVGALGYLVVRAL